ncbi:MAG TPA: NAD(P)H-hydrate dehydratase [Candidatus Limnocylindrales bacterium]|nr:NAD(P)H-hydrate dehydratase [Candidatus Limnocylindrales bacterium]
MVPRVGVDVTAIERIEKAYARHRDRFLRKFLTEREIAYCGQSAESWAGRWAAKEAIGKAMPSGIARPRMIDVEILPRSDGRPHVSVGAQTTLAGRHVDVSIAHDGHFAIAVAVIPDAGPMAGPQAPPEGFRLPDRPRDGHKGTFGTVVALAGSQGFTGAAYLTSMGAARSGAGLVRLLVAQSIYPILAGKCTEVMVTPVPELSPGVVGQVALSDVLRGFAGADAGVIGPGIGRDPSTRQLLEDLIPRIAAPLVLDADALNLLAEHRSLLPHLVGDIILTPHPAEFSRLSGLAVPDIQADREGVARRFAQAWAKVVVLKGARSVIAAPDGRVSVNEAATPTLASGGTGDVLAGLIAGLRAQGLPSFEAAVAGVHLHGLAGLQLEEEVGRAGVLASDVLGVIPRVMERLRLAAG